MGFLKLTPKFDYDFVLLIGALNQARSPGPHSRDELTDELR
jgi:hypothetical protein